MSDPYLDAIGIKEEAEAQPDAYEEAVGFFPMVGAAISEAVTGKKRETRATRELPEALELGVGTLLGEGASAGQKAAVSAALPTVFDPDEFVQIIKANTPDTVSVAYDEKGGVILQIGETGKNERVIQLNRPGFSATDLMQGLATGSLFTPAGMTRQVGLRSVGSVAGKSALTQGAVEAGHGGAGGDFNKADIAIAGAAGGFFQGLGRTLLRAFPSLAQTNTFELTDEIRQTVSEHAIRMGFRPEALTDDVIRNLISEARSSVTPEQALAISGEREFGIPLTSGQRSLGDKAVSFEDRARAGGLGEGAQRVMRDFEREVQLPAVNAAVQRVGDTVAPPVAGERVAGETVLQGVRSAERAADDLVSEAYDPANIGEASLSLEGVNGLLNATRKAVIGIDKDRGLPGTAGLLGVLKSTQKIMNTVKSAKDTPWQQIEMLRKRIGTAIDSADNNADFRQLTQMKRAFDDYLDKAVIDSLFSGDEQAIANLKNARGLFSEYAGKFRVNPTRTGSGRNLPDPEGTFIEKIISGDPTGEQTVNAIFGASGFSRGSGRAMAQKFKDILGEDSEAWQAIRRTAFNRFIKTNSVNGEDIISGQRSLTALNDAVNKNESLLLELFSQEEISTFRRLFAQVQRTTPAPVTSRENPSGTAQVLSKNVMDVVGRVAALLGGDFGLTMSVAGVQASKGFRNSVKASNSIRPFQETLRMTPAATAAGQVLAQEVTN